MEYNAKLQKAIASNMRETDAGSIEIGNEVYYKRNDSTEWKGPAKVIGRDGKQLIVKHGSIIARVHCCRLTRTSDKYENTSIIEENKTSDKFMSSAGLQSNNSVRNSSCENCCVPMREEVQDEDEWYDSVSTRDEHSDSREVTEEVTSEDTINQESDKHKTIPIQKGRVILKAGQRIKGMLNSTGSNFSGKVIGRSGKSTGIHKNCYNIRCDNNASETSYDVLKEFCNLELVPDDTELLVLYNSDAVSEAKMNEVKNWEENCVFEEVEDHGQEAVSVRWIVTEKQKEGKSIVKARLVARGFEEEKLDG